MRTQSPIRIGLVIAIAALAIIITGCEDSLAPMMSYQGRLTDETGEPLEGTVNLTFKLYDADSGGTAIYSESKNEEVSDGLFDTTVGPATVLAAAGLTPKDLAQPLWLEMTVGNGTYTETLAPRQRLLGSPYAFTLMPGAVVSGTMGSLLYGAGGIEGVLSVNNPHEDAGSDLALPALLSRGEKGIELRGRDVGDGTIYSDQTSTNSDIQLHANDDVSVWLDADGGSTGYLLVYQDSGNLALWVSDEGDARLYGDLTANGDSDVLGTKSAVVEIDEEQRLLYSIESPEVWFEDFGAGTLSDGSTMVSVDALFAKTVNLDAGYHVFLTPLGDCNGLYVANKTGAGFEVRELGGGASSVSFDYRIVAHRAGYEDLRLELQTTSLNAGEAD